MTYTQTRDELLLKQIWFYLLQSWSIPVEGSAIFKTNSSSTTGKTNTSPARKRRRGFFLKSLPTDEDNSKHRPNGTNYSPGGVHYSLKDLDPNGTKEAFWETIRKDSPDGLIMRFIRARNYNLDKAMEMLAGTLAWRLNESDVNKIILGGERAAYEHHETGFIKNVELQKAVITGKDREGRPIVYIRSRLHYSGDQTLDEMKKYSLLIIEIARLYLEEQVETATVIFDLTGFTLSNMDYGPVVFLINCFEAHYPECLGRLFIHCAPWIFPPIWSVIKKLLDPVVASKISFTKSLDDLLKYIDIDNIPSNLGGNSKYPMKRYQKIDESYDAKLKDTKTRDAILKERGKIIQRYIEASVEWIENTDEGKSHQLKERRRVLEGELKVNYRKLDQYIRSRTMYDVNKSLQL